MELNVKNYQATGTPGVQRATKGLGKTTKEQALLAINHRFKVKVSDDGNIEEDNYKSFRLLRRGGKYVANPFIGRFIDAQTMLDISTEAGEVAALLDHLNRLNPVLKLSTDIEFKNTMLD